MHFCLKLLRPGGQIADEIEKFFETNPNESIYVGVFGIGGNAKVCWDVEHT